MGTGSEEVAGFRKLYRFSRLLLRGDDPETMLEHLMEATRAITDADEVLLFYVDTDGEFAVRAGATDGPSVERGESTPSTAEYSRTLIEEVVDRGKPMLLQDVCEDPKFEEAQSVQFLSISSAIGAPLFNDGELEGVIYASRKRLAGNFTEKHRELMTVAASQASLLMGQLASLEALRASEARYRSLVEMSPSAVAVVQDQQVVFANRTARRIWNRDSMEEFVGCELDELFDPWRSQALLASLRAEEAFESVDAWVVSERSGEPTPVEVVGRPIQFEGRDAMQLTISEVGVRRDLLDQRVRLDRLTVMGTMAAMVGHEINNPLSYVYANLDFAIEELDVRYRDDNDIGFDNETCAAILDGLRSAREGSERIRSVIESMQKFTRLEDDEQPARVERPLRSSLRIVRAELDADVELDVDIEPTPAVAVDAARLGQVFLNLLINAAQALSEQESGDDEKRLEVRAATDGDQAVVEITDTGPGIDPEMQRHVFEPFVTTKDGASGSGLGLAICHDIVSAGGGTIDLESKPGEGTRFRIRLPVATISSVESLEEEAEPEDTRPGRILVVDRDPTLGRSVQRVLQCEHVVEAVTSTEAAVALMEEHDEKFDLVLCEIRRSGEFGRRLFEWAERQKAGAPENMVAMTTRQIDETTREYVEELPNESITKPFDLRRLRVIVAQFLETASVDEQSVVEPS